MGASVELEIKFIEPSYGSVMPTRKHVSVSRVAGEPLISEYVTNYEFQNCKRDHFHIFIITQRERSYISIRLSSTALLC